MIRNSFILLIILSEFLAVNGLGVGYNRRPFYELERRQTLFCEANTLFCTIDVSGNYVCCEATETCCSLYCCGSDSYCDFASGGCVAGQSPSPDPNGRFGTTATPTSSPTPTSTPTPTTTPAPVSSPSSTPVYTSPQNTTPYSSPTSSSSYSRYSSTTPVGSSSSPATNSDTDGTGTTTANSSGGGLTKSDKITLAWAIPVGVVGLILAGLSVHYGRLAVKEAKRKRREKMAARRYGRDK